VEQKEVRIREVYAHVWTENEEALQWYEKRGFRREGEVVKGYYRRLKPDTAWILRRRLVVADYLAMPASGSELMPGPSIGGAAGELRERPGNLVHTKSFQDRRPDVEWNDLPEDVLRNGLLKPPSLNSSAAASATSSRSSSRSGMDGKGRKKRQYPAAAFGN
jgi:hypothetical protein